jgi:hypothetical protein
MYEYGGSQHCHWHQQSTAYNWHFSGTLPHLIRIADYRNDGVYLNFTLKMEDVFFAKRFYPSTICHKQHRITCAGRCNNLTGQNNVPSKIVRGKATIITYSECVFLTLGIQHAMRIRHTVIGGMSPL